MENEELTKAQLEKVRFEIKELKYKCSMLQRILSLAAILITVGGLWIGGLTLWMDYKDRKDQGKKEEAEKRQQANLTFGKSLLEKHLNIYFDTVDAVSKIATTSPESKPRKDAEERFRQLYNGGLILVEDGELNRSKVAFADCLLGVERICAESPEQKEAQLEILSQSFATIAKTSLARQWKIELSNTYDSRELPKESRGSGEYSKLVSENK